MFLKNIGKSLTVMSLLGLSVIGCGSDSSSSKNNSTNDTILEVNSDNNSSVDGIVTPEVNNEITSPEVNSECLVSPSGMDFTDQADIFDSANRTNLNIRYQMAYSGEGDCISDVVDIKRVAFAKFDWTDNYSTVDDALSFGVNMNGDYSKSVITLFMDMDNDISTGMQVGSGSNVIGADKTFIIDFDNYLDSRRIETYENFPDRLKVQNDFAYASTGNMFMGGWYAISMQSLGLEYFTNNSVKAIVYVDMFDRTYGGRTVWYTGDYDMTPVFTINPF